MPEVKTLVYIGAACALTTIAYVHYRDDAIGSTVQVDKSIRRGRYHVPFLGSLIAFVKYQDNLFDYVAEEVNSDELNRAVVLSLPFTPPFVFINDTKSYEYVMKTHFENYIKGDFMSIRLFNVFGNGIFNSDGDHWLFQRKVASRIFTTNAFKRIFETVFQDNGHQLLNLMKVSQEQQTTIDLHDILHRYFLDSFGKIAFGLDLKGLTMRDDEFALCFDKSQKHMAFRFYNPFWKLIELLNPKVKRDMKYVRKVAMDIVQDRKNSLEPMNDLLTSFMEYKTSDGAGLKDEELVDQVLNFIIAGRDTTAQTLSWVFYHLHKHPEINEKLRKEINSIMNDNDTVPTYEQVKNMKYALAVFHESLRVSPVVPIQSKTAVEDDLLPNGTVIQKGVTVMWSAYAMGQNENIWQNAKKFHPERWIENSYSQYQYPAFNAGPRVCLGKAFAELQGVFVLATILKHFQITLVEPHNVAYAVSLTLPMTKGLFCKVNKPI
ncbi:cytochrome P450 [Globomyces pollinis-pini]|nr:cytochrome P450 [Globomyces pollinis-pini]